MENMTFSAKVKQELCRRTVCEKTCCIQAEAYGVLLLGHTFRGDLIRINTTHPDFAFHLPVLFARAFQIDFDEVPALPLKTNMRIFSIKDSVKIDRIFEILHYRPGQDHIIHLNNSLLESPCCLSAFWRGAFLAGGSMTDPAKKYYLELLTPHRHLSGELTALMHECGLEPKQTIRDGVNYLYFIAFEPIENFLTLCNAPLSSLAFVETTIEKEIRNDVNRKVNCETGNLTRTVEASLRQKEEIGRLKETDVWETLPFSLREAAEARLLYPESSLSELAEQLKISKSCLNHRLRKIQALGTIEQ